jgi:hypothetical protein
VILLTHDAPATPAHHVDDRQVAGDTRRRPIAIAQGARPEISPSGDAALKRLVRLLARQAAQEQMSEVE